MQTTVGDESSCCQALLVLLRTADTVWNASRLFFERWKVSPSQFNVLNLLHSHPAGMSQSELGRQLIMHRSNVTGLVDRLEARGLVAREDVELDRRAYSVGLTREGREVVENILPEYYAAAERLWRVVPEKRLKTMMTELKAVAANALRIAAELEKLPGANEPHPGQIPQASELYPPAAKVRRRVKAGPRKGARSGRHVLSARQPD